MKRPLAYLAVISIVALVASCLNTLEPGVSVETGEEELNLTAEEAIAAARECYERHKEESRVVCGNGDQPLWPWQAKPHAPYDLGEYEIVWESGYIKNYPGRIHVDFDIIKEHDFVFFPDTNDHHSGMKLRSRFVSVQSPDTTIQYIATYIPHEIYYDRYYSVRHGGGSIGLQEVNFSGRVLHTTLDGYHYAAYRVWQGVITKQVELYNNPLMTMQQRYEEFFNIMENYHIGVCKLSVLPEDDVAWTTEIEKVIVVHEKDDDEQEESSKPREVSYGTVYKYTPDLSQMNEYVKFYKHFRGGGPSNDDEEGDDSTSVGDNGIDGRTPEEVSEDIFNNYGNLADSVKTKVNTMIAEIAENCMGKQVLSMVISENIGVEFAICTTGNSTYKPSSNTIEIANFHSEDLLHELFHTLQLKTKAQGSISVLKNAEVNYEIESYIATYAYVKRSENRDVLNRKEVYDRVKFWQKIASMEEFINSDGSICGGNIGLYVMQESYIEAITLYTRKYPNKKYDNQMDIEETISLIRQIIQC